MKVDINGTTVEMHKNRLYTLFSALLQPPIFDVRIFSRMSLPAVPHCIYVSQHLELSVSGQPNFPSPHYFGDKTYAPLPYTTPISTTNLDQIRWVNETALPMFIAGDND